MGIWDIMGVSVSALRSNQTAMEVISHNVANMNTTGYSRQVAILTPNSPRQQGNLIIGRGVDVTSIDRVEDRFLNYNVFMGSQSLGYQDVRSQGLDQIQEIFNESSTDTGLSSALTDFWNGWADLAGTPEGVPERTSLRGTAEILITEFNTANSDLRTLQKNSNTEIKYSLTRINQIVTQIADLNIKVMQLEANGQSAGDYRTERNILMEELSTKIDFNYFEDESGMVTINVAGGLPLVEQSTISTLDVEADPANNGYYNVLFVSKNGVEYNITDKISSGALYGNLQIRDEYAADMLDRLDELAYSIINEVNAIHQTGTGLNGSSGNNFFTSLASAEGASRLISIDASIDSDVSAIAAGLSGDSGDNQIANQLSSLRDTKVLDGGQSSFQDFYGAMIADIGVEAQNAEREYNHADSALVQMKNFLESQTGVVIEEEMSNLIRYQQAYQAASRMINAVQQMVNVLADIV